LPLVAPWPPVPLIRLVVASPPPLILSASACLLTCHLHLPPAVCFLLAPAGCRVAPHCAAFATHCLDTQPPLNAPADCSKVSCCPASAAHPIGVLLPLDMPPPPPTPICLLFALAGCCVTSRRTALLIVSTGCCLSTCRLVVALPLVALPLQLILLTCHRLLVFRLVVVSPLIALPPPRILSSRPCLSTRCFHLQFSVCLSFAQAGCHVPSHQRRFADVGARAKGKPCAYLRPW
jgi:hypothetical protein